MKITKKKLYELNNGDAKVFFLKHEAYCNFRLPKYFNFSTILKDISKEIKDKDISGIINSPKDLKEVNYKIITNKDGLYSWRPLTLIHPLLYVNLVNNITENDHWEVIRKRFISYKKIDKIKCTSIPVVNDKNKTLAASQISVWWEELEQQSIIESLKFSYVYVTDISDCYGSIYTHSIPWALHGKEIAKKNQNNKNLIGNQIDRLLREMSYGESNGIPQGSVLMDFIAEILLGALDEELAKRLESKVSEYKILRYRDDYRIFVNSPTDGEQILRVLTELLIEYGMQLNSKKTKSTSSVVENCIKVDKLYRIANRVNFCNLSCIMSRTNQARATKIDNQKILLTIHNFSRLYPNSGSVIRLLNDFCENFRMNNHDNPQVLIAIVIDIAYNNPNTYPDIARIISKILKKTKQAEKKELLDLMLRKFEKKTNSAMWDIWMQRISYPIDKNKEFGEKMTKVLSSKKISLWDSSWIKSKSIKEILKKGFIDQKKLLNLSHEISKKETNIFTPIY